MTTPQALITSVTKLIQASGLKVKITPLDGGASYNVMAVFGRASSSALGTSGTIQQVTRIVIPSRYAPQVGDFVNVNGVDYRIKTVTTTYANGKPLVYVLDLT